MTNLAVSKAGNVSCHCFYFLVLCIHSIFLPHYDNIVCYIFFWRMNQPMLKSGHPLIVAFKKGGIFSMRCDPKRSSFYKNLSGLFYYKKLRTLNKKRQKNNTTYTTHLPIDCKSSSSQEESRAVAESSDKFAKSLGMIII